MVGFCVFMANESCSNAYKLTGFNDLIKFYDAKRILSGLLVLARLTYCGKEKKRLATRNYFQIFMKIENSVTVFLQGLAYDLWCLPEALTHRI